MGQKAMPPAPKPAPPQAAAREADRTIGAQGAGNVRPRRLTLREQVQALFRGAAPLR